jgi:hypothetical protein
MAGKYAVPILLATVLAGGAATATAAMAAVETQVPALRPAGHWQAVPPDTTPPNAPTNLRLFQLSPSLIRLTWDPSTDGRPDYPPHPRVIAYDIYASTSPFRLIASVPAGVLTYVDRRSPCVTVSYYVKARDSAGNVSPPSNVVTRQGHGKCDQQDEQDKQDKQDKQDETNKLHKFEESDHDHSDDDKQIIKADKFLHVEDANDHGGGGHDSWDRGHHHGGHDFGPEHEGEESGASAGHQPAGHAGGGHEAGGQQAGRTLPFTGAPVAAVAGVGGALLVAGVAGVLISVRRRRSTGAR